MLPTPRSAAICLVAVCFASVGLADDFKTIEGKEYKNATVSHVEPDGIVLRTKSGMSKVYFVELPREVQERFHYDAAKAAQFTTVEQAAIAQSNAAVGAQQQQQTAERQREAATLAQQRQRQMQQEQIAAKQEQRQLGAQQKQDAKIAAQKQAREQQQRKRRTTGGLRDHSESWKHTFPGGYEEMSGNTRMGHRHSESHNPYTDNVTDESWGPAR